MTARIPLLKRADLPQYEEIFSALEADQSYVSNSLYILARQPSLLTAIGAVHDASWYGVHLTEGMRDFVAYAYSMFRGVPYSASHCATNAERHGMPREKIVSIFDWETSPVYDEAERAVLRLCRHAARMPNEVTDQDVAGLRQHFDEAAVVAIVGLIAMMSFLNTWNSILATPLEAVPKKYAEEVLGPIGWTAGPHG